MKIMFVFTELNQKFGALRSQHGLFSLSAMLKQKRADQVSMVYFAESLDLQKLGGGDPTAKAGPDRFLFHGRTVSFS